MKLVVGASSKFYVFLTASISKLKNPTDNASKDYQELFLVKLILIFGFKRMWIELCGVHLLSAVLDETTEEGYNVSNILHLHIFDQKSDKKSTGTSKLN